MGGYGRRDREVTEWVAMGGRDREVTEWVAMGGEIER